jgi:hypothetical protein
MLMFNIYNCSAGWKKAVGDIDLLWEKNNILWLKSSTDKLNNELNFDQIYRKDFNIYKTN